ncbi:Syf2p NDAI_0G00950 [Naumovozyma dairenensis CBS 421]|uniref:Pre-mRNA-splicing factor SYF2 n=1 Tax=Naumovozyma dairenensis (strain ATCC 10597 / BCRC 20456 / CBS 421 / NBRC 0211 / NRRL Y-12639) TaxID=1071378 RepID=G0WDL0_NAUDC|nr:hypothetical protein NDAI_0G00950 [Naumovozyma dairenensis CBS 421]CCD25871.2 hypothetical protein NDAI_0G00950 [Naumovozyma dairenensis CBS 421]
MKQEELDVYEENLKALKRSVLDIITENRKRADQEVKEKSQSSKPKVYDIKAVEDDDNHHTDYDGLGDFSNEEEKRKFKLMNYTIREYEEWDKQQKDKQRKRVDGSDLTELATFTYEKELSKLNSKLENISHEQKHQIGVNTRNGKLNVKDEERLLNNLVNNLNETAKKRYMVRKKKLQSKASSDIAGNYFKDKNKQFNEKLERELKERDNGGD